MKTVYLNTRTSQGVETIDEFTREENQSTKEFNIYVRQMIKEYNLSGQSVYISSRCTKDWSNK